MFELRDYQKEASDKAVSFLKEENKDPSLMVLPTAAGKSIIIADIVKKIGAKTLVLQPSKELLEQNIGKFRSMGGEASIYSASLNTKEYGHVTYATIGSIVGLAKEFKKRGYTHVIIDEADRYPRKEDGMFNRFLQNSGIEYVIGLTATPFKLQTMSRMFENYSIQKMLCSKSRKNGITNFWTDIIHITQIKELVDKGFWAKLEYELYDLDTGDLVYNSTKADFTEESLKKYFQNQNIDRKIINKINLSDRKSILVFVPSVADAVNLAEKVPNSVAVYGNMDKKERAKAIQGFREGKIRTIFNVNVLSVGFDHPQLDCIICGRPTASLSWLYQAYGRGTRIHPDKKDCLIVDFSGNSQKFGKIEDLYYKKIKNSWNLFGTDGNQLTNIPLDEIGTKKESHYDLKPEEQIVNFGKYRGKKLNTLPKEYLKWIHETFKWTNSNKDLKKGIETILDIKI